MTARPTYVVLGAGLAGHSAAEAARQAGFDGRLVLIGDEPVAPYDRPPLSKAFLQGKREAEEMVFRPDDYYRGLEIELLLGMRVTAVDFEQRQLSLDNGETIAFDKMVIATGAHPIRLPLPGFDLPGVHYVRNLRDTRSLREDLRQAEHLLVIGAGFIGSEVAASARILGRDVTLVDLLPAPMSGVLGREIGDIYAEIHRSHGVDLRMERRIVRLHGSERVEAAEFDDGERIDCDVVVVGVGVRPAVELFIDTPLEVENGIIVDEFCQTNIPGVYAAGDVANWWHAELGRRMRVEHFDNAALQGAAAGKAMAGQPEPYHPTPYFWSDQYDVNLQYAGFPCSADDLVLRGDRDEPALTAFYREDGRILAAVTINQSREFRAARKIVELGADIDPAILADPDTDLRKLSRSLPVAK